jgi:regulator of protease activity HflC (stomatin/prohibitin superfamily)
MQTSIKLLGTLLVLLVLTSLFVWFGCRIEVESGMLAVLTAKTGKNLPSGRIIATESGYKGIQLAVLAEGLYFRNPLFWDRHKFKITTIPAGNVGVQTRRFGTDISAEALAQGKLFAEKTEKGLIREVLRPGNYRINPYAYDVEIAPAVEIPAGFVGVVTELAGTEPSDLNQFIVKKGEKGVQPGVLQPGIYYVNPYARRIDLMDIRSQRHEMFGRDALRFPTSDGFDMRVLLIVEWAVDVARAPEVRVRIGEQGADEHSNEILQKIVIPAIRGYGRIIGSQYSAPEYISGKSRIIFQSNLLERVQTTCMKRGVQIKSILISDIDPPQEIAGPIREREIAKEELTRNESQIMQAKADQQLAFRTAMIGFEAQKVQAQTKKLQAIIAASNRMDVAVVEQEKKLAVASIDLEAAEREASAVRKRGKAQADVIVMSYEAEAEALKQAAAAFGSGKALADFELLQKVGSKVETIFTTDESSLGKSVTP